MKFEESNNENIRKEKKNKKKKSSKKCKWKNFNIDTIDPFTARGEDTTTYGDCTPWLQPGTPLGDRYIEQMGYNRRRVNESGEENVKRQDSNGRTYTHRHRKY